MSKNRVIITLLAIFLIAGMTLLVAAEADKPNEEANDPLPVVEMTVRPALTVDLDGVARKNWENFAQIGGGYNSVSNDDGYDYIYVSKVYGTTDASYNGYYKVIPSTSISASNSQEMMYLTAIECMLHNHWVYMKVDSEAYVYELHATPYIIGDL